MNYTIEDLLYSLYLLKIANSLNFYCMLAAFFIGLIGNTASVIVYLSQEFRKRSYGTYFAALGIFEMLFLLSNVVYVIQPFLWRQSDAFCKSFRIVQSVLQFSCSWILVLNSLDRVALITMPNRLLFMRKIKFQITVLAAMFAAITAISMPNLMFFKLIESYGEFLCSNSYSTDYFHYNLACSIIYLALPFFIMLACSLLIVAKLKKLRDSLEESDNRRSRDYDLTKTVLMSNVYFLVILLPYCIIGVLVGYFKTFDFWFVVYKGGQVVLAYNVCFSVICFFHATTFLVHLKCNKLFRQILVEFFRSKFFLASLKRAFVTEPTANFEMTLRAT